jgi:hypothetical protein
VSPGKEIVLGPDGLANGELREGEAIDPVRSLSKSGNRDRLGLVTGGEPDPRPTAAEFEHDHAVMKRGLDHCARHGITSIHNMDGNLYTLELLDELDRCGQLLCRVRVPFHMKNFMDLAELEKASAMRKRYHSEKLGLGLRQGFRGRCARQLDRRHARRLCRPAGLAGRAAVHARTFCCRGGRGRPAGLADRRPCNRRRRGADGARRL